MRNILDSICTNSTRPCFVHSFVLLPANFVQPHCVDAAAHNFARRQIRQGEAARDNLRIVRHFVQKFLLECRHLKEKPHSINISLRIELEGSKLSYHLLNAEYHNVFVGRYVEFPQILAKEIRLIEHAVFERRQPRVLHQPRVQLDAMRTQTVFGSR